MDTERTADTIQNNARQAARRAQVRTCRTAQGLREYQLQLISAAHAKVNAMFEYLQKALQAQSISDLLESSTAHTRRQFELIAEQSRDLAAVSAQKIAAARPLATGLS